MEGQWRVMCESAVGMVSDYGMAVGDGENGMRVCRVEWE